jgi:ABC-type transport system involved in multi-copper enzyme maturation permease subunit
MSSLVAWLRRTLAWSNSRQSWQERLAVAAVLAGGGAILLFFRHRPLAQQVVLWGLFLAALAAVARRGWLKLFGPVLFYDLVRIARRNRYYLIRVLYAAVLLAMLSWVYLAWTVGRTGADAVPPNEAAAFAGAFFYMFMGVQFLIVTVVTPAYTAGAVAEEKERKTLEYLLATDLRNREIVLSKLASRLLNLVLLLLTGLPVLAALQFLGGVDPGLVLAGFVATGLTVASLAGLSIYNSTMTRRARDAIVLTYLMAAAYLGLSGLSWLLLLPTGWADFPSTTAWTSPVTLRDVVEGFNVGNIVAVLVQLSIGMAAPTPGSPPGTLDALLPAALAKYALFHGAVAVGGPLWAVLRLRRVALKEASQPARRARRGGVGKRLRRVGLHPMLWKEVFAEGGPRFNVVGRAVVLLLVFVSFAPTAIILFVWLDRGLEPSWGWSGPSDPWDPLSETINLWQVRVAGTGVACLLLLAVAVRAAGSVSGERDRQTLDGLLTTPLDSDSILFAKWLGAITSVRRGWVWLGAVWVLGLVTLGLHPVALLLLAATWLVYAAFVAGLGLWFSVTSRTTLRATTWTLVSTVGAALGHWLVWLCCVPLFIIGPGTMPDAFAWVLKFQAGLTPPAALGGLLPFRAADLRDNAAPEQVWEMVAFAVLGTVCWAVLAALLWAADSARFRLVSGRARRARPRPSAAVRARAAPAPDPSEPPEVEPV